MKSPAPDAGGWRTAGYVSLFMVAAFACVVLASDAPGDKKSASPEAKDSVTPKRTLPSLDLELDRIEARRKAIFAKLKLDDDKAKRVNDLFDQKLQAITKLVREAQENRRNNAERIDALLAQLEQAKKAKDITLGQEAIKELQEIDEKQTRIFKAMLGFDSEVAEALGEQFKSDYRDIMEQLQKQWGTRRTPASFTIVQRLLDKVKVNKKQRAIVHKALVELSPALSESNKKRQERRKLMVEAQFRQRALDVLTDAQRERYLQLEEAYRSEWKIPDYPPVASSK